MPLTRLGEVITFYSYKGGTGRSMALANVACLLAQMHPADKVLMIDWDLEAPGLHRYFQDYFKGIGSSAADAPGLIDLFVDLDKKASSDEFDPAAAKDLLAQLDLGPYLLKTDIDSL